MSGDATCALSCRVSFNSSRPADSWEELQASQITTTPMTSINKSHGHKKTAARRARQVYMMQVCKRRPTMGVFVWMPCTQSEYDVLFVALHVVNDHAVRRTDIKMSRQSESWPDRR